MFHAIFFGIKFRIIPYGFLRLRPLGFFALYKVPAGEEFEWMGKFNTLKSVISTELNTIIHVDD